MTLVIASCRKCDQASSGEVLKTGVVDTAGDVREVEVHVVEEDNGRELDINKRRPTAASKTEEADCKSCLLIAA